MERTDADGRWESDDEVTWLLVEPSAEFLADQKAQRVDEPAPEDPDLIPPDPTRLRSPR